MKAARLRSRVTYANITATLALALGLSTGGAYAAAQIGAADIKDDAVRTRHIADSNVTKADLRDGAVTGAKLAPSALPSAYFARNPEGVGFAHASGDKTTASLTVPAGTYQVQAVATGTTGSGDKAFFSCGLYSPTGALMSTRGGALYETSTHSPHTTLAFQGLTQTSGGNIEVRCRSHVGNFGVLESTILATRVGTTTGPVN